jgi:hypothetical protein
MSCFQHILFAPLYFNLLSLCVFLFRLLPTRFCRAAQIYFEATATDAVLAWVRSGEFEMYLVLSSLCHKQVWGAVVVFGHLLPPSVCMQCV